MKHVDYEREKLMDLDYFNNLSKIETDVPKSHIDSNLVDGYQVLVLTDEMEVKTRIITPEFKEDFYEVFGNEVPLEKNFEVWKNNLKSK